MSQNKSTLYRAPYVVPVSQPIIEDGAVLVIKGRIAAVDTFSRLKGDNRVDLIAELQNQIIVPGLINCHAHLELSWMAGLGRDNSTFAPGDITAWIISLLAKRDECIESEDVKSTSSREALQKLYESGTVLVADIGNQLESAFIGENQDCEVEFYHESMGLSEKAAAFAKEIISDRNEIFCTAHGPYSCHPEIIRFLKERARELHHSFPIHLAESIDEIEFLKTGKGPFEAFLESRLSAIGELDDKSLADVFTPPQTGAVDYLDSLGILDDRTICVHGVHVSDEEINTLAQHNSKVCFCPGSNEFLGVGMAPAETYLKNGILPGLGTDSLASNPVLSIWNEMQVLAKNNPAIDPEVIFSMATIGGAQTLHSQFYGTIQAGKSGKIVAVDFDRLPLNEVYAYLACDGEQHDKQFLR